MRFGLATADISPPFRTTMGGYGARQDHFDDINDPLVFTALILEERGKRSVIGSADLITFENDQVMELRKAVAKAAKAPVENVMLNASHTHGGPEVRDRSVYFHADRDVASSRRYCEWLAGQVIDATKTAAKKMEKGSLWYGIGTSQIPMNRRLERDGNVVNAPNPEGKVDDRLQVLAVKDAKGVLRGLGVRLSCHPVATGAQHRITADYPGAFRAACASAFGAEVTPFFLQGAGGDMRPRQVADDDRWRVMKHEELPTIGEELLVDTLRVLTNTELQKIGPLLLDGHLEVAKPACEPRYTKREQFEELAAGGGILQRYAAEALRRIDAGESIPSEAEVRVHTLWLTKDMAIVGIQGEVLVGLGAYVERTLAPSRVLLLGYTNGCLAYLPDSKELARGGYEQSSFLYRVWTGPFKRGLEKTLAAAVYRRK